MFTDNPDFYPTPKSLFNKMWAKIPNEDRNNAKYWLEPQAGQGHIIEYIRNEFRYYTPTIHAIEKDPRLIATLKGKNIPVIDQDFLTFCGPDKYDIIIANPPFSGGEYHLLKMIDIMYSGHIVCLLNSNTIKNPCTHLRKQMVRKLAVLGADIEYMMHAFTMAERKTDVEIALIHIHIDRKIENDLFDGIEVAADPKVETIEKPKELVEKDSIRNVVADYNRTVEIGTQVLLDFYRNHYRISKFLTISVVGEEIGDGSDLTALMQCSLNSFLKKTRRVYWQSLLQFDIVARKMTRKRQEEFRTLLNQNEHMDFTEANILTFITNLIKDYDKFLTDATIEIFEVMSIDYAWDETLHLGNVHYFDGWKTNKAFFVNRKVIIPYWNSPFYDVTWGRWKLNWQVAGKLDDIDKVMNSFDGASSYISISKALTDAFEQNKTRKVRSTYFEITVYKKGTIHLTFLDEDIRRRFNVTACKGKNWLPQEYGQKTYDAMAPAEKKVVDSFEGEEAYNANVSPNARLFRGKNSLQIAYVPEEAERAAA